MSRTRHAFALVVALASTAVPAYAGTQPVNFGPTELGQIKTACFTVCFGNNCGGSGTINSLNVGQPFFVRGIRVGPNSAGDDLCNNTPGVTTPATLPRTLNAGQRLVFDVDLVPTQLGNFDRTLSINGNAEFDLMANVQPLSGCATSPVATCLQDDRFKVRVHWRTNNGTRDAGDVVPFGTDDSGLFYFFNPDNWEVLLKVLRNCNNPTAPRFWVFAAATTNVEYTITVTDTQENVAKPYFKAFGPPSPAITDTNAFATCP